MKKNFSLPIKFKQETFNDERFLKLKVIVMHEGLNLNNSSFSMDAIELAKDSIVNIPILAFVKESDDNENDFAGHEMQLVVSDSEYKIKYLGRPIGVIPANDNNYRYEIIDDKTYVVVDGYVWKDYANEALDIIKRDGVKSQSMEIMLNNYAYNKDGICEIKDYKYTGVTLLGDDVPPAMVNAKAEIISYSTNGINDAISSILSELHFSLRKSYKIDNSKESMDSSGKWYSVNKTSLKEKLINASNSDDLIKETYLVFDKLNNIYEYPHHEIDEDKLVLHKTGLEKCYSQLMLNDPDNTEAIEHLKGHFVELGLDINIFNTNQQKGGNKMEDTQEKVETTEAQESQESTQEEFVETETTASDEVEKELEIKVEVGEESETDENVEDNRDKTLDYQVEYESLKGKYEALESEFTTLKESFATTETELTELREFKATRLQEDRTNAENEIFEKFSTELNEDELKPVKDKVSEYSLEDLEDKLFALAGRKKVKFSLTPKTERIKMGVFELQEESHVQVEKDIWTEQKEKFSSHK